jgi:hypothetical protein
MGIVFAHAGILKELAGISQALKVILFLSPLAKGNAMALVLPTIFPIAIYQI